MDAARVGATGIDASPERHAKTSNQPQRTTDMTRETDKNTTRNATRFGTEKDSDSGGPRVSWHYWDRTSGLYRAKGVQGGFGHLASARKHPLT
ncbi:hypothetical protein BMS3Bbin02_00315 [bacterium BMS3Bbin02]|nr:hypothetical protein BMS3Bbin02_00315 [bacterium BMS3Bbin02]